MLKNLIGVGFIMLFMAGCAATSPATPASSVLETPTDEFAETTPEFITLENIKQQPVANPEIPKLENELSQDDYVWSQLLARDAIAPIYEPQFSPANEAPYDDGELVIGVALNGEAKAYAIGPLNNREMVNDTLGGVPILVTW